MQTALAIVGGLLFLWGFTAMIAAEHFGHAVASTVLMGTGAFILDHVQI